MEVKFYENIDDDKLKFSVILARYDGKFVFCKHRERNTYEVPGGHREAGEDILTTAKRELAEETGAIDFSIKPVCAYSVKGEVRVRSINGKTRVNGKPQEETFGMLYVAEIFKLQDELHSEISKIIFADKMPEKLTYPLIQPKLLEEAQRRNMI